MPVKITEKQEKFIEDNKDKMKQKDIAARLGITPACVCQKINGRKKEAVVVDGYFDLDNYKKLMAI